MAERYAGEVKRSRSRITGTTVVLLDTTKGGDWAGDESRWITLCDEHNTVCEHPTRAVAESHMPYVDWCEPCGNV